MKKSRKSKNQRDVNLFFVLLLIMGILFAGEAGRKQQKQLEEKVTAEQKESVTKEVEERQTAGDTERIRVLIRNEAQDSNYHQELQLSSDTGMYCPESAQRSWGPGEEFRAEDILSEGETIVLMPMEAEGRICADSLEKGGAAPHYEGQLQIQRREEGFLLVNVLDLETYLKYVVPSEMPAAYPQEALKAQAVCARTYARRQMMDAPLADLGADVDDTVNYQVYAHVDRQPQTDQAVDETRGMAMYWEDQPIQAYFFSTSWGCTSTDAVWDHSQSAGYLPGMNLSHQTVEAAAQAGADELGSRLEAMSEEEFVTRLQQKDPLDYEKEDPWYRWETTLPGTVLQERFAAQCPEGGQLQKMEVRERSCGGAAVRLYMEGTTGSTELTNEYQIRQFLSVKGLEIQNQEGTSVCKMTILPSAYFYPEKLSSGDYRLRGGGYGHGVGMSQNGAKHLAEEGMDWESILHLFYRKVKILAGTGKK